MQVEVESMSSIYGKCLCCLAEGKHVPGDKYFELFRRCLNLNIVPESQMTLLCSTCISFLNEVQTFREMVLVSQRKLHESINIRGSVTAFVDVPVEGSLENDSIATQQEMHVKEETCDADDILDRTCAWPDNVTADDIDDQVDVKNESETNSGSKISLKREDAELSVNNENDDRKISKTRRKRNTINDKTQRKKKRKKCDSESDTPISQIKEKEHQMKKKETKPTLSPNELVKLRSIIKENNLIRSNIILLLEHSTITPFLNNFKSPFKCFYCDKQYIPFRELKEHTETEHVNICENKVKKVLRKLPEYLITADISCLRCKICDGEFKSVENLTEHLSKIHDKKFHDTDKKPSHGIIGFDLNKDGLKCHICSKDFPFFKNLLVHMNEHGSFVCYICGKKFFSERKYRSHVSKHEKTGATSCKKCGKTFVSKSAMVFHNRKEHIKSRIKCLKCPETFPFEHYVQRLEHMEKEHGIKKPVFKCETCGKECKSSGTLSTHVNLTHKRSKEYRCDVCSYATFNSSHFRNHMNTHTGVKMHECQYCKKGFLKMYSLTRHLMMHMNDKRFTCPLCDAAFIQKVNMKSHMRHRHKDSGIDLSTL